MFDGSEKKTLLWTSCLALGVYAAFVYTLLGYSFNYTLYIFPLFRLIDCALGILLYRFYLSGNGVKLREYMLSWSKMKLVSLLLIVICFFVCSFFAYRDFIPTNIRGVALFWPFAIFFIFYGTTIESSYPQFFSMPIVKALAFIGDISMEIYLTHEIVNYIINIAAIHLGIYSLFPSLVYLIKVLTIPLFAWLSRRFFVNPIQQALTR